MLAAFATSFTPFQHSRLPWQRSERTTCSLTRPSKHSGLSVSWQRAPFDKCTGYRAVKVFSAISRERKESSGFKAPSTDKPEELKKKSSGLKKKSSKSSSKAKVKQEEGVLTPSESQAETPSRKIDEPQGFGIVPPIGLNVAGLLNSIEEPEFVPTAERPFKTVRDLPPLKPFNVPKRDKEAEDREKEERGAPNGFGTWFSLVFGFLFFSGLISYIPNLLGTTPTVDLEKQEQVFAKKYEESPEDGDTIRKYADTLIARQKYEDALPLLEKIVTQSPDDPLALRVYAQDLEVLGRFDESLKIYDKLIDANPGDAETVLRAKNILEAREEYDRVADLTKKAADKLLQEEGGNPTALKDDAKNNYVSLRLTYGQSFIKRGLYDQGIAAFDSLIKEFPKEWRPLVAKGSALELQDPSNPVNRGQATALYAQARLLSPKEVDSVFKAASSKQ